MMSSVGASASRSAEPGPPAKFWEFDDLVSTLTTALRAFADSRFGAGATEQIDFSLRNEKGWPYRIRVLLSDESTVPLEATPEIDQIVVAMVALLSRPPRQSWQGWSVEVHRDVCVCLWRAWE